MKSIKVIVLAIVVFVGIKLYADEPTIQDLKMLFYNSQEDTIHVDNQDIVLTSKNSTLYFVGNMNKITIKGNMNDIYIDGVNEIEIVGNNNFIEWKSSDNANGKPIVKDKGGYNNVGKFSTDAMNKSDNE